MLSGSGFDDVIVFFSPKKRDANVAFLLRYYNYVCIYCIYIYICLTYTHIQIIYVFDIACNIYVSTDFVLF